LPQRLLSRLELIKFRCVSKRLSIWWLSMLIAICLCKLKLRLCIKDCIGNRLINFSFRTAAKSSASIIQGILTYMLWLPVIHRTDVACSCPPQSCAYKVRSDCRHRGLRLKRKLKAGIKRSITFWR